MRNTGVYLTFCLLLMCSVRLTAQQDAQFSQYMFNPLYLSPGFAGVEGVTRITAFHRSQWQGYESSFGDGGAPTTQLVSFTTPIHKLKSGFGAYLMNDRLGPQNNFEFQGMYAYHLGIKENKLSIALKIGLYSQTIDGKHYRYIDQGDNLIVEGKESQVRPDIGAGIVYRTEKYYVGVGINHLSKAKFDFGQDSTRGALKNHMNITAGYYYDVNFDLQIYPTILVKTDFNALSYDFGIIATLRNTMWGGLAFRRSEAAYLLLGYSFLKDKSLRLGYSIDFVIKDRNAKENFSHEIMLTYELPVSPVGGKKIVRTPRYRH